MANDNVSAVLAMKGGSGGGGGSGTDSNAVHYSADSNKTDAERAAALANVGGEPRKLTVTVTESGGVFSANKTHAEIKAAYDAGKTVEAVYDGLIFRLVECGSTAAAFIYFMDDTADGNVFEQYLGVSSANAWTHNARTLVPAPSVVEDTSSNSITILSATNNTIYEYGTLNALTVTAIDASGDFIIRFSSGSTATTTNFPASMKFPEAFAAEANTRYEISVSNGYALVASWPVS